MPHLSFPVRKGHSSPFQHPLALKARLNNAINSSIHLFCTGYQGDTYRPRPSHLVHIDLGDSCAVLRNIKEVWRILLREDALNLIALRLKGAAYAVLAPLQPRPIGY